MKIIYTIAGTYRAAGMERVLADKTAWLCSHGYEVMVVTTEQKGRPSAFEMDPSIRTVDLGIGYEDNNGGSFLSKLLRYPFKQFRHRKMLASLLKREKADIVVSMFCNDESFLPKIKDGSKKVLEVHFSRFKRIQYGRKGIWALADKFRSSQDLRHISKFDRFVVLTEEDKTYWGNLPNIEVIQNSIGGRARVPSPLDSNTVIAVGRLSYQKSIDRLIDAWKIVCDTLPSNGWRLRLVGDGEMRRELETKVRNLGLDDSVEFAGVLKDMDEVYSNASILALSSRYEGLPMVLLEAQAHGVPAVSFACKCGPRDVIENGKNGLLVEEGDVEGLARAIVSLIRNPSRLKEMGKAAYEDSVRWDRETIMGKWDALFRSLDDR